MKTIQILTNGKIQELTFNEIAQMISDNNSYGTKICNNGHSSTIQIANKYSNEVLTQRFFEDVEPNEIYTLEIKKGSWFSVSKVQTEEFERLLEIGVKSMAID